MAITLSDHFALFVVTKTNYNILNIFVIDLFCSGFFDMESQHPPAKSPSRSKGVDLHSFSFFLGISQRLGTWKVIKI
jgi:hypothetical protein